ncbi:MAG: hypothetical protein K2Q14_00750 [Gammaproteobacteria bacterium]|nr:hypothetical protein [Gammaproteobacteria bacterium]
MFLGGNNITPAMLAAFLDALIIAKLPRNLYLYFSNTSLTPECAFLLANKLLMNADCPPQLSLEVNSNQFGLEGAAMLIEAIKLSKCQKLKIDLSENELASSENHLEDGDRALYLRKLIEVFKSDNGPKELEINLSSNRISDTDCAQLIESLPACKSRIYNIDLSNNSITEKSIERLTKLFSSERCWSNGLVLNIALSENFITDEGITKLIDALALNYYPEGLSLNFQGCKLTEQSLVNLFMAMKPGNFSKPLNIDLGIKTIREQKIFILLMEVLIAGNYPLGLKFNFNNCSSFSQLHAFALLAAWEKGFGQGEESLAKCPFIGENLKNGYLNLLERNKPDKLIKKFRQYSDPEFITSESSSDEENTSDNEAKAIGLF